MLKAWSSFKDILGVLLFEKSSSRFAIGVLLGFSFSIAVILSTVGIMDGFEVSLKKGLRQASGDVFIFSDEGFFDPEAKFFQELKDLGIAEHSFLVKTEGFVMLEGNSRGVLIQGVETQTYQQVTGTALSLENRQIAIGQELAQAFQVKEGDSVLLALADGNRGFSGRPRLESFVVGEIFQFGIYQKDLRLIYMNRDDLQQIMGLDDKVNLIVLNVPPEKMQSAPSDSQAIEDFATQLRFFLGPSFSVRPYWSEFSYLLDAVKTEKFWIGMILQIVVVISIFNVLAFIIFINEKKAREIFLLKALGLSQKSLRRVWYSAMILFWVMASFLSYFLVKIFNWLLNHLAFFQLPGDVYHLGRLELILRVQDYALVFGLALLWLLLLSWLGLRKVRRQEVLFGLRREFN